MKIKHFGIIGAFFFTGIVLFCLLEVRRVYAVNPLSWIGLFQAGAPNTAFVSQIPIECLGGSVRLQIQKSCTHVITAPKKAGIYEFRFFHNGFLVTKSARFTVNPASPTATIGGPDTSAPLETVTFSASASGESLEKMLILISRKGSLLEYESSWQQLGETTVCNGNITCNAKVTWTPGLQDIGRWYIMVKAWDKNGTKCSGNPKIVGKDLWNSPEGALWYSCSETDLKKNDVTSDKKTIELKVTGIPNASSYDCQPDPKCLKAKSNLQLCSLVCRPK